MQNLRNVGRSYRDPEKGSTLKRGKKSPLEIALCFSFFASIF